MIGLLVRWTTEGGRRLAGTVRWIAPDSDTLHVTCDPKVCGCDHEVWHVVAASRVDMGSAVALW